MITIGEIASLVGGELKGEAETPIYGVGTLRGASQGQVAFLLDARHEEDAKRTEASAVVCGRGMLREPLQGKAVVFVQDALSAFVKTLSLFERRPEPKGLMEPIFLSKDVSLGEGVTIYPFVYVGARARIGNNVTIYPLVTIGEDVEIGDGTVIYPNVTIYPGTVIGKRVRIHAGSVVGSDGFGYFFDGKVHVKIPQIGNVIVEDDVEIGANVAVDRATIGSTIIRRGVKIDNLVQVAHNVEIGEDSLIVAQVGIAGSVTIGRNVILAGQVGVRDHVRIGDNVRAAGKTGITKDVKDGETVSGNPHMRHDEWKRLQFYLRRLPLLFRRLKELEARVKGERDDRD
jgi:UDP-3-O-[3-hydroxymyristoyl] glucosamine N-acyltransferase